MSDAAGEQAPAPTRPRPSRKRIVWTVAGAGAAAAVVMLAIGWVFNRIEDTAFPSIAAEYRAGPGFRDWPGWTETYMFAHPIWFGFVFAAGFAMVSGRRCASGWAAAARQGAAYGALLFLIGSLPVFVLLYASVRVSVMMVAVSWAGRNLVQYVAAGMCVGFVAHWRRRHESEPADGVSDMHKNTDGCGR